MIKDRLYWVDCSKGFAIFLVVVGHVIAYFFPDYHVIITESPSPSLLWRLIYVFHVPLMMFISGYLSARRRVDASPDFMALLKKLIVGLLVPDVIMSALLCLYRQRITGGYWYLEVMFAFVVLAGLIDLITARFVRRVSRGLLALCAYMIFWCLISVIVRRVGGEYMQRFTWMFPFFIGGLLACRCGLLNVFERKANAIFGFVAFVMIFIVSIKASRVLAPWAGLLAVICLFHALPKIMLVSRLLRLMGLATLQIYTVHLFFKVDLRVLGDVSIWLTNTYGCIPNLLFQLIVSSVISAIIIAAIFVVVRIVDTMPVMSKICFGRSLFSKGKTGI